MALVIGMQEGRSFFLNDIQVDVERIHTPKRVTLLIHDSILKKVTITDTLRAELIPNVFASIGTDTTIDQAKIALEAPRNIKILRDNLYHEQAENS